jgi:hypothetical protein
MWLTQESPTLFLHEPETVEYKYNMAVANKKQRDFASATLTELS